MSEKISSVIQIDEALDSIRESMDELLIFILNKISRELTSCCQMAHEISLAVNRNDVPEEIKGLSRIADNILHKSHKNSDLLYHLLKIKEETTLIQEINGFE